MIYNKQIWINNVSSVNKEKMDHIENGIYENSVDIDQIKRNEEALGQNIENIELNIEQKEENVNQQIIDLKTNKILWQDAYFMNENQTANLSEKVSEQNTGIVLVFSAYSDGEAHDYGWYEYFIPKTIVSLQPNGGHSILIPDNDATYGVKAGKYLYVSDTQIRGSVNNVGTHGNLNNSSIVLRYVIGV